MSDLTVLVTGCGAPGTIGTLWSLDRNPDDRTIRTVGTDLREDQPGRFACDSFHRVPPADDDGFVDDLLGICDDEAVDVVLPQVTAELPLLASASERFESVGTNVAISSETAIDRANDKGKLVDVCDRLDVPTPETILVETWSELEDAAARLGYPERPFVVKPPVANGQRGFRIVSDGSGRKREFYEEKPDGTRTTMDDLRSVLGDSFPGLLAMEYLPGEEFTVDVFRSGGRTVAVPRRRDAVRSGISFRTTAKKDDEIIEYAENLSEAIGLEYAFGFQFKRAPDGTPAILECNPRIQGTMVTSTLAGANLPYAAVKAAIGESTPEFATDWGTTFYRYWGGIGVSDGEAVGNIGEGV